MARCRRSIGGAIRRLVKVTQLKFARGRNCLNAASIECIEQCVRLLARSRRTFGQFRPDDRDGGALPAENSKIVAAFRNRRCANSGFLASIVVAAGALTATAQTAAPDDPEAARRALEVHKLELDAKAVKAQTLQSDVSDLDAERERLNARLVETAALVQRSEAQLTSIEGRMVELEAQEKIVRGSLGQRHGQIATLLGALQRMGRNPPPVLITRREDALKMVRSAMLLSSAFPELRGQAVALSTKLEDLVRVMGDIRSDGQRLQAETDRLNASRNRLASLMDAKKSTIAERQGELQAVRAALAESSKNVDDLSQLIAKLDENPTLAEKTGLGAYENELKASNESSASGAVASAATGVAAAAVTVAPDAAPVTAAATSAPAPAPASAPVPAAETAQQETVVAALQPPRLKPQIIELAPSPAALAPGNAGRMKPAIPFATAHAKLPPPAHGRRALSFGDRTQYGGQSKGLVLETRAGAQITSPCDGWIVYAGEFRSYGQLLIINAGDGYHILLAGLSQIDVQPGQFVLAAEPVGTMGGATKPNSSAAQVGAPVLYVEFRKDGLPIDPDPWWASGQQKVQG
jgi:septal ring factor EnvC (AmiA/AmiB activator)